jgi:hypothetical protein
MPSLQTIAPNVRENPLEKTLAAFSEKSLERQTQRQDTDALSNIYKQFQNDKENIQGIHRAIQTDPNLSPTARVNAMKENLEMAKHNAVLQKTVQKQQVAKANADKAQQEAEAKQAQTEFIEENRGLPKGSLKAFNANPELADRLTKPASKTQASQPLDEDQLRRIEHTLAQPGFNELSTDEQNLALLRNGVSKENTHAIIQPRIDKAKIDAKTPNLDMLRDVKQAELQAKADYDMYADQVSQFPALEAERRTLDRAAELNAEGVTGHLSDQALEKAGLMQFTSDGRREFTSLAKDAVKNQNIKSIIGSQISQLEFGFFRDATINPNFSQAANDRIIKKEKLANRYKQLYADITKDLVDQNGGKIPVNLTAKVNDQYKVQAEKISKELRQVAAEFEAIQNVPDGYILMYDDKRRPLHVPENEAKKYEELGATQT